jgi:hypothetical protein
MFINSFDYSYSALSDSLVSIFRVTKSFLNSLNSNWIDLLTCDWSNNSKFRLITIYMQYNCACLVMFLRRMPVSIN